MMSTRSGAEASAESQWPPKSPHEALLGTPSGRERYRRMVEQTSPSPSPTKRTRARALTVPSPNKPAYHDNDDDAMDLDEEEDEEILQLKLQAIQAKLRLKKLQSAKAKTASETTDVPSRPLSTPNPDIFVTRTQSRIGQRPGHTARPQSQSDIQVPASPVRGRSQSALSQTSPSRVQLGIDKGLRGKDISLKRAPTFKKASDAQNGFLNGAYPTRTQTPSQGTSSNGATQGRPKTFSERLAAARTEETTRRERQARISQARSTAFELGKDDIERFKSSATDIPDAPQEPVQFSREEVLSGNRLKRSSTIASLRRPSQDERGSSSLLSAGSSFDSADLQNKANSSRNKAPSDVPEEDASGFEPYSSIHLSKRIIPHPVLTRNLSGKKAYVIKDLLKHVKAPEFELPEIEQDIVVFGILASKSEPRSHKPIINPREKKQPESDPERGKYMVLKLVDLQWELELFLFNTGFDRYWKLTPGTLLAILNPTVMPPPPNRTDTGRFSLVINSGQDTILEIGTARDLGFCKSTKKDGELCSSWINRKRTEFCEFHMNAALTKHRQARQDINAFDTGLGPGGNRKKNSGNGSNNGSSAFRPYGNRWGDSDDRGGRGGAQGPWFVSRASSAATMLDNECLPGQVAERVERGDALRRRLATEEKERDLMKRLGRLGSGAGKEYMQLGEKQKAARAATPAAGAPRSGTPITTSREDSSQQQQQPDARSLGLLGGRGCEQPNIHLSPVKRKRTNTFGISSPASSFPPTLAAASRPSAMRPGSTQGGGAAASTSSSSGNTRSFSASSGLGWGGALKDRLSRMKDGAKLQGGGSGSDKNNPGGGAREADRSPVRKKTRFVTEKGIREAGRESLGGERTRTSTPVSAVFASSANGGGVQRGGPGATAAERGRGRMVVLDNGDDDDDDELVIVR